jgi:hypothetical protein
MAAYKIEITLKDAGKGDIKTIYDDLMEVSEEWDPGDMEVKVLSKSSTLAGTEGWFYVDMEEEDD